MAWSWPSTSDAFDMTFVTDSCFLDLLSDAFAFRAYSAQVPNIGAYVYSKFLALSSLDLLIK